MRRNLTISFDEDFIREMDRARGQLSRGFWIERGCAPLTLEEERLVEVTTSNPVVGKAEAIASQSRSEAFRAATQKRGKTK